MGRMKREDEEGNEKLGTNVQINEGKRKFSRIKAGRGKKGKNVPVQAMNA
jgi:hypothetical protein